MDDSADFLRRRTQTIEQLGRDQALIERSRRWLYDVTAHEYSYHFDWWGRPIIQFPMDVMALQEVILSVQPEVVVETGVARGGSLIFSASMLELLGRGEVIGVDIDIRSHNRAAIEAHPMSKRIHLIQGSSVDASVVAQVAARCAGKKTLVILDSNHTHDHVAAELVAYAPLVSPGAYLIVLDTIIEFMPEDFSANRPWAPGNNPWTAVQAFLPEHPEFEPDDAMHNKLLISVAPGGYLKRRDH